MRDWVAEFYKKQNDWLGVYLGPVTEEDHRRAQRLQDLAELNGKKKVLELGGGGGQTALAIAQLGHEVDMVELLERSANWAKKLAEQHAPQRLNIIQADFYDWEGPEKQYDLICYFDSFGIGSDLEQKELLKKMHHWLAPDGLIVIEVGASWYWSGQAWGQEYDFELGIRRHEFDPVNCRLLDKWWLKNSPEEVYQQSLRCYTPADFELLLENIPLKISKLQTGPAFDEAQNIVQEQADWADCMTYFVCLQKESEKSWTDQK